MIRWKKRSTFVAMNSQAKYNRVEKYNHKATEEEKLVAIREKAVIGSRKIERRHREALETPTSIMRRRREILQG